MTTSLPRIAAEWPAVSELLDEALALPVPARARWLERLCGPQAAYRDTLAALLATQAEIETQDFLEQLPALLPGQDDTGAGTHDATAGAVIGGWRLLSQIGEGGMGVVWLAERADGLVKRPVALKLPRQVWGGAFADRLAREREILASLDHEHIARLYDAGVDAQGRPFLATEYVEGVAIGQHCQRQSLGVRERIGLLLQVMAAVAHAHARLVVHRDLKPGNILVKPDGQVRLLDFGIAKLLEGERTRETLLTEVGGRALTLDYASPEQIRGEPLGTASDVYSMAVVAYELLAGTRPYRLKRASAAELEEAIAGVEPPSASSAAVDRRVAPALRGDLDAILNKALKKTPAERYPTMDAFAQDLRRHLTGEPVDARPDGLAYRASRFVQRHRVQVAAAAVTSVALIGGSAVALWQAQQARLAAQAARVEAARARAEAATAQAVQGFIESVFDTNTKYQPDPAKAARTTARELLDRGAERIDGELASEPEAQRRLYDLLGDMYGGLWQFDRALPLFRRSLELATRLHGETSDAALIATARIAHTLDDLGQRDAALATLQRADANAARRPQDSDAVRMQIDQYLARIYLRSDLPKAVERARRAAAIARALGPSVEGLDALQTLGEAGNAADHLEEARQALAEAVNWSERLGALGVQSWSLGELGNVQDRLGQVEAADASFARAVALAERLGDDNGAHMARWRLARFQLANRLLRQAVQTTEPEAQWARTHRDYPTQRHLPAMVLATHARTLMEFGDAGRGLAVVEEALAALPPETGPALRGQFLAVRAVAFVELGRLAEAGAELERATAMTASRGEAVNETVRVVRRRYLVASGQAEQALQNFRAHPPAAGVGAGLPPILQLRRQVEEATLLAAAGRHEEARLQARQALAAIAAMPDRPLLREPEARLNAVLGQALLGLGRADEALPVLRRSLALQLDLYDPLHSPSVAGTRAALAMAERQAARVAAPSKPRSG